MSKQYDANEWRDLVECVAQTLYESGDFNEEDRFKIIDVLESYTNSCITLSTESKKIFDRHSHLDASHIGKSSTNPSFYVCLDNIDFWYDPKVRQWTPCHWETPCLDDIGVRIEKVL